MPFPVIAGLDPRLSGTFLADGPDAIPQRVPNAKA
jgi:hypothetical protein